MIPYLEPLQIGPVNSFGLLVMLGVFFGSTAAYRHAERTGLDPTQVRRLALWCGASGLIGAHLVDVLLYQPEWSVWTLINPLAGISSMGGVVGGAVGFFLFAHFSGIRKLAYADAAALGLLVLLVFGRAGCASVHDHVGRATSFALAVDFPAGNPAGVTGPHHDLGLYEFVYLLALVVFAAVALRTPRRPGWLAGFLAVAYAIPRFAADFLRRPETDPRYLDLTFAQWTAIAMLATGVAVVIHIYRRDQPPLSPTANSQQPTA